MGSKFDRTGRLRQIPVLALRDEVKAILRNREIRTTVIQRIRQVLKRSTLREPEKTIDYLNRDDLVRIINKCPEIGDDRVQLLFEEYRYGANPSFFIYLFEPEAMRHRQLYEMRLPFRRSIEEWNRSVPADKPKLRSLVTDPLIELEGYPEVVETTYRYQRRVDLIDENENAVSLYETVYGFFWINIQKGYAVIQAHDRPILYQLRSAIQAGAEVHMIPLSITKELKKSLSFLIPDAIFSSRLHEPDPASPRFHWVSITDDRLSNKMYYENWEQNYEVSTARYRIDINGSGKPGDTIQRTLTIDLDDGGMSLAGKLTATQFRVWALNTLQTIITTMEGFKRKPQEYVRARRFISMDELRAFQPVQREHITRLVAHLIDVRQNPGSTSRDIETSPLKLARDLGKWVDIQFRMPCPVKGCDTEGYFLCPSCGSRHFNVLQYEGKGYLQCALEKKDQWFMPLPFTSRCPGGHEIEIAEEDLERWIEILPHTDFLKTIAEFNKYLPEFKFLPELEYFMIRGRNLSYYADRDEAPANLGGRVTVIIHTGNVYKGGTVIGVNAKQIQEAAKAAEQARRGPPQTALRPV